jgi:hypothetical protein
MEIDNSLGSALTKSENQKIAEYSAAWQLASDRGDLYGMQAAHDATNAIRLRILDSVERVDFINGGSSTVFKPIVIGGSSTTSIVQPYLKMEAGAGVLLGGSVEAKLQDSKFTLSIKSTIGGIGASVSASGGVELAAVNSKKGAGAGIKFGEIGFIEMGGTVATDATGLKGNLGVGLGLGAEVKIPLASLLNTKLEGEYTLIDIKFNSNPGPNAPTAAQWLNMLQGYGWYGEKK